MRTGFIILTAPSLSRTAKSAEKYEFLENLIPKMKQPILGVEAKQEYLKSHKSGLLRSYEVRS